MRKSSALVRNYFILPCCLLLLNLANSLIGYKAELIADPIVRTAVVIFLVLCGASLVTLLIAPAITLAVKALHRTSRRGGGRIGEILFLVILAAGVAWCYYQLTNHGPAALLPADWRNGR